MSSFGVVCLGSAGDDTWDVEAHAPWVNEDCPTTGMQPVTGLMQPVTGLMHPGARSMVHRAGLMQPCHAPCWVEEPVLVLENTALDYIRP